MRNTTFKDGNGATFTAQINDLAGRQNAVDSKSISLSNEDYSALITIRDKLNASIVVTGTFWQATQPVSLASLPSLPTGGNVIGGVTQSGFWNIANITGTVSLPTGASTAANQASLIAAIGAATDAAWTSGSGSTVALLKAIAAQAISTADSGVEVHQPADVISFTPTLDTSPYAAGDVLFATAQLTGVTRANDLRANLISLTAIDKSKNAPAMTLLFYQTNVTSAAANAANNLSDADQANLLGFVSIAAADWKTYANNSVLCYSGAKASNLLLEAASGTTSVYVVGILDAGTPTFAAGDLVFKFGVVQS